MLTSKSAKPSSEENIKARRADGMHESASSHAIRVVNLSEMAPHWNWVNTAFCNSNQTWHHVSTQSMRLPSWIPRGHTIARLVASWQAVTALGDGASVLVSHGPRPT